MTDSRRKGMRRELEAQKLLLEKGVPMRRTYSGQAAEGGADGCTESSQGRVLWEVKRVEQPRLNEWIKQVDNACQNDDDVGCILWKRNRGEWFVVIRLDKLPLFVRIMSLFWHR